MVFMKHETTVLNSSVKHSLLGCITSPLFAFIASPTFPIAFCLLHYCASILLCSFYYYSTEKGQWKEALQVRKSIGGMLHLSQGQVDPNHPNPSFVWAETANERKTEREQMVCGFGVQRNRYGRVILGIM
jgi:hypothetical protein